MYVSEENILSRIQQDTLNTLTFPLTNALSHRTRSSSISLFMYSENVRSSMADVLTRFAVQPQFESSASFNSARQPVHINFFPISAPIQPSSLFLLAHSSPQKIHGFGMSSPPLLQYDLRVLKPELKLVSFFPSQKLHYVARNCYGISGMHFAVLSSF